MSRKNQEQYRQTLEQLVKSGDCPSRPSSAPEPLTDWTERAAAYHDLYVAERDAEVRWEICDAARRALTRLDEGECQAERESRQPLPRAA